MTADDDLAALFEEVTLSGIDECKQLGYNPTAYLVMVRQHGAVGAAKRVLRRGHIPSGFSRVAFEMRRPDLTTEATALQTRFQSLFTEEELAEAERRLGRQR